MVGTVLESTNAVIFSGFVAWNSIAAETAPTVRLMGRGSDLIYFRKPTFDSDNAIVRNVFVAEHFAHEAERIFPGLQFGIADFVPSSEFEFIQHDRFDVAVVNVFEKFGLDGLVNDHASKLGVIG